MTETDTALARINIARKALAEAKTLEQALDIRSQAAAIAAYARAKGARAAMELATEIQLRSERKAGEFLQEKKQAGKLGPGKGDTLSPLGITKKESSRWQHIASIPEDKFEDYLETSKQRTQSALLQAAARLRQPAPVETPPMPEGRYRLLIIDPPWPIEKSERAPRPNQGKALDYPTMTLDAIASLPLPDLVDKVRGTQIYLWTTHRFLPDALQLFRAWGVRYHCLLTWVKPTGMTPFSWMFNTEFVLFGYTGPFEMARKGLKVSFEASVSRHSAKPEAFYLLVEQASPAEDGERLDMFARKERHGWDTWGA